MCVIILSYFIHRVAYVSLTKITKLERWSVLDTTSTMVPTKYDLSSHRSPKDKSSIAVKPKLVIITVRHSALTPKRTLLIIITKIN
jgi:hypothetical protein